MAADDQGMYLTVDPADRAEPVTVLTAVGEIDHDNRQVLDDAAGEALRRGRHELVIDLSGVTFCDSGGLSLFVQLHRLTGAAGGTLRLAGAHGSVLDVLHATNLDRLLPLHPTADEAVRAALGTD